MTIAIIGGSGKMGRWCARFLLKEGKKPGELILTGRNQIKLLHARQQLGVDIATNAEAVARADVVIVSVPIDNFEAVIEEISPQVRPGQAIIDITSVKVRPVEITHKLIKTGLALGVHPMFGPGVKDVAGQNFILTPTSDAERVLADKVRDYLEARGASVTLMSPSEHDEMMAVILGLSHFIAIISADTLSSIGKLNLMEAISGTTYRALLTLVESVVSEDPELYAAIQMNLPNLADIEELFQKKSKTWAELVRSKDRQEFVKRMSLLRNSFKKDAHSSPKAS
jgi:prephenate dehydrogenase